MSKKEGIERLKMESSWNQVWFASQTLTCIQKGCVQRLDWAWQIANQLFSRLKLSVLGNPRIGWEIK